jgi:hypothetical protein
MNGKDDVMASPTSPILLARSVRLTWPHSHTALGALTHSQNGVDCPLHRVIHSPAARTDPPVGRNTQNKSFIHFDESLREPRLRPPQKKKQTSRRPVIGNKPKSQRIKRKTCESKQTQESAN